MTNKPITFRASEKALEKIKATMEQRKVNRNQAINFLLEETPQPQLEHPKTERGYPPFLWCSWENEWLPTKQCIIKCESCPSKKVCGAWKPRENTTP